MLFDHGVDAVVASIAGTQLMKMFCAQTIPSSNQLMIFMTALFPFYFITLEAYYTGFMYMGKFNGVDDTSYIILILGFISGYYGNVEMWT